MFITCVLKVLNFSIAGIFGKDQSRRDDMLQAHHVSGGLGLQNRV